VRVWWLAAALCLGGCDSLRYYAQVVQGGYSVLARREPITRIVDDPSRDATLRQRLQTVQQARRFAVTALHLPDNGSYTRYSEVHAPFVVYNVFATPALSLKPIEHCFPVAGCVAYRGYYAERDARAEAWRLQARGYDTFVGGVTAYSTLGWFDDPVLSTMLRWDDERLAATIFHELAHQAVYVKGDTAFNESFAEFVEREGLRQWRVARGLTPEQPAGDGFDDAIAARVLQTRTQLETLYASTASEADQRAGKAAALTDLQRDYRRLKVEWRAGDGYEALFAQPLNNAVLLPFGLYHQWRPVFAALYAQVGSDWPLFYQAVRTLSRLPQPARQARLQALAVSANL
jgi:predicted aminopeptidase